TGTLGFTGTECRAVVLGVYEWMTIIIRHAYQGQTERPIEASFRRIQVARDGLSKPALEIVLKDRGIRVNAQKLCGRPLEEIRSGGCGLHFMLESLYAV